MATSTGEPSILEIARNVIVTYKGTVGEPLSVADVTKIARVEPITIVSSNLTGTKELYNILHGVLNIYSAYYLQAISILSAQLVDVRILKILDKTNPDRDIKTLLTAGYTAYESYSNNIKTLSLENAKYKLPMISSDKKFATESIFDEDQNSLTTSIHKIDTFERLGTAVGKVMEVKFTVKREGERDAQEVSIPVVVKLDTMIVPSDVVGSILSMNEQDISFGARFKEAISGRIRFIKDFILCSDLIKSQKKTMIKDPTGYYNQLLKRINNSRLYSAISGNISLAGISSIFVISEEDENEIQKKIGGKLTNQKTREIVFDNISAMAIVVVDRSWERVSIYIRDIDGFSQNSFDDFKSASDKNSGVQIQDILKSFSLGNNPVF
jgi:hypothetical protein